MVVVLALFAGSGTATSSAAADVFRAQAPRGGGFECLMGDAPGPAFNRQVLCVSHGYVADTRELVLQEARLTPRGKVETCIQRGLTNKHGCNFGNAGEGIATFPSGKVVKVGRFRCRVLDTSVKCTVTATGKGFLISTTRVLRIRPARTGRLLAIAGAGASSPCPNETLEFGCPPRKSIRHRLIRTYLKEAQTQGSPSPSLRPAGRSGRPPLCL